MSRHRKRSSRARWPQFKQSTLLLAALFLGIAAGLGVFLNGPRGLPTEKPQQVLHKQVKVSLSPAAPGHWLMTSEELGQKVDQPQPKAPVQKPEPAKLPQVTEVEPQEIRSLNQTLNNLNILYLWTDDGQLKVLSIMSINRQTKEAALVVIPRFTRITARGQDTTIDQLYQKGNRVSLTKHLESLMGIKIPNFLNVDQQAVIDISELVGPLTLKGEQITILEAFEQTRDGKRTDDQDVVRAVARKIVNPKILIKLPEIIWIFTHDVKSNLGTEELLAIYRVSRESKVTEMRKVALPGEDVLERGEKFRLVSQDTWQNIFYDLTK